MSINFDNSAAGNVTLKPGASGNYSMVMPVANAAGALTNDGAGNMSFNAGTVTMPTGTLTAIGTPTAGWTAPTLAADNTNKGLTVTSGYNAATNINWVCTLQTSELIFA